MTNDDRKYLEDRIYDYGVAVKDGSNRMAEKAWDRLSYVLTKLEKEKGR